MHPSTQSPLPDRPLVSVIMSSYNYANYIAQAIGSVFDQTYSNIELIIVDDGSRDHSREVIDREIKHAPMAVKTIYKSNGGQASAWNAGYTRVEGELVGFIDSDDLWYETKVDEMVDFIRAHPDGGVYQHQVETGKGFKKKELISGDVLADWRSEGRRFNLAIHGEKIAIFIPSVGLMFRKHVLDQIFPIDPGLVTCPDGLVTRAACVWGPLYSLNIPLGLWRDHESNAGKSERFRFRQYWLPVVMPTINEYFERHEVGLEFYYQKPTWPEAGPTTLDTPPFTVIGTDENAPAPEPEPEEMESESRESNCNPNPRGLWKRLNPWAGRSGRLRIALAASGAIAYDEKSYLSWLMAEALAHQGHQVTFITGRCPVFYDDFNLLERHPSIWLYESRDFFHDMPRESYDCVVLVPLRTCYPDFYYKIRLFARRQRARLASLSFETPAWVRSVTSVEQNGAYWKSWKLACDEMDLMLSFSGEGLRQIQTYLASRHRRVGHDYCYPSIHSVQAEAVGEVERGKHIVLVPGARFHTHHTDTDYSGLISETWRGYTLTLLDRARLLEEDQLESIQMQARTHGVKLEHKKEFGDAEKFRRLKQASLAIYPSLFESFGLGPIEAQYCETPCLCFDLPILRETSGDGIHYAPPGDWKALADEAEKLIVSGPATARGSKKKIEPLAAFETYSHRLDAILRDRLGCK